MNISRVLNTSLALVALLGAIALPVRADDIDEKQANLQSRINEAATKKQISGKDAGTLRKEMSDFSKKKAKLRDSNGGALTLKDDQELDKALGTINQDFESKKKK